MKVWHRAALAFTGLTALLVIAFFWNEARKEVVFLCGNFAPGVDQQSVVQQLGTGHFLRYRIEDVEGGRRIVADSVLTLSVYQCVVELDVNGIVIAAGIE